MTEIGENPPIESKEKKGPKTTISLPNEVVEQQKENPVPLVSTNEGLRELHHLENWEDITERKEEKRKRKLKETSHSRQPSIFIEDLKSGIVVGGHEKEKFDNEILPLLSKREKRKTIARERKKTIRKLKKSGIEDAEQMVERLEEIQAPLLFTNQFDESSLATKNGWEINFIKLDRLKNRYSAANKGKELDHFDSYIKYDSLEQDNVIRVIKACGGGEKFAEAVKRAALLRHGVYHRSFSDIEVPDTEDSLTFLANIKADRFYHLADILTKYPFLEGIGDRERGITEVREIAKLVDENGGLNRNALAILDQANQLSEHFLEHNKRNLAFCLDNPEIIRNYWEIARQGGRYYNYNLGVDQLNEQQLRRLANLARKKIDLTSPRRLEPKDLEKELTNVEKLFEDKEGQFLLDIAATIGERAMTLDFLNRLYQESYPQVKQYIQALNECQKEGEKISSIPNFDFSPQSEQKYQFLMFLENNRESAMKRVASLREHFSDFTARWKRIKSGGNENSWLISHHSQFPKNVGPEFFEEYPEKWADFVDNRGNPSSLFYEYAMYYCININWANLPNEALAKMDSKARLFFGFHKNMHQKISDPSKGGRSSEEIFLLEFIPHHRWGQDVENDLGGKPLDFSNIEQYVMVVESSEKNENGDIVTDNTSYLPKPAFFKLMLEKQANLSGLNQLLSDSVLAEMNEEDRKFWKFFRFSDFPMDEASAHYLRIILAENKEDFDKLVADGVPTIAFIEKASHKNAAAAIQLLSDEALEKMSEEDRKFWEFCKKSLHEKRSYLLEFLISHRDQFDKFVVDGIATSIFIQEFTQENPLFVFRLLTDEVLEKMNEKDRRFWLFCKSQNENQNLLLFLINNKDQFEQFVVDDIPTAILIEKISQTDITMAVQLLTREVLEKMSEENRKFWQFFKGIQNNLRPFLLERKDRFKQYVDEAGEKTNIFYKDIIEYDQEIFIALASKDLLRKMFNDTHNKRVDKFLRSLPSEEIVNQEGEIVTVDEQRNALTHNEHDRTSGFLLYLTKNCPEDFRLNREAIEVLTDYINNFGLAENATIFHYFYNLWLLEKGKISIDQLPKDIGESKIDNLDELHRQIQKVKERIYREEQLTSLAGVNPFEISLLRLATGKDRHRFDFGRPSLEVIISDWEKNYQAGRIKPIKPEYTSETIRVAEVKYKMEISPQAQQAYEKTAKEAIWAIDSQGNIQILKQELEECLRERLTKLSETLNRIPEGAKRHILLQIEQSEKTLSAVQSLENKDINGFLDVALNTAFNNQDKERQGSLLRRAIFAKVFARHNFSDVAQLRQQLNPERVNHRGVLRITEIIDTFVKDHVLNLESNKEGYWSEKLFQKIKKGGLYNKTVKNLLKDFRNLHGDFQDFIEIMAQEELNSQQIIQIIPDRGIVGEMAGYLADVCYTKEYPLLVKWQGENSYDARGNLIENKPFVTPYKFVQKTGEDEKFIGSVLVFEVKDQSGNKCLLIRAFDIPKEEEINISAFIESFLDNMAALAKRKEFTSVLITGKSSTISNYPLTNNHVKEKYVKEQNPIPLSRNFAFNGYDITDQCYLARKVN